MQDGTRNAGTVRTIRAVIEGREPVTASPSMIVSDAARQMKRSQVGAILVVEGGRLVGIFTERDALFRVVAEGRDPTRTTLDEAMTRKPITIHPDKPFSDALAMMHVGKFRRVPVVEGDKPIGMVSAQDVMGPELEQFMFGLIVDEQTRDVLA